MSIYCDDSPKTVIRKSVQSGLSERNICLALASVQQGLSVFYVLPTQPLRNRFVTNRVDPLLSLVPYYADMVREASRKFKRGREARDATSMKQIGDGSIAFVGSNAASEFTEFVADVVIIDEIDRCDQANLALAKDRTGASEFRYHHVTGNPTFRNTGISAAYRRSDMKQWFIQCTHCNEWQTPNWLHNVMRKVDDGVYEQRSGDLGDPVFVCLACDRPIDRHMDGEWIAQKPYQGTSGYHVSQLFSGTVTLSEMYEDFKDGLTNETARQRFWNSVLGEPFESEGVQLTDAVLDRCVGDYGQQSTGEKCFIGVDVGAVLHVVVIEGDRVVKIAALHGRGAFAEVGKIKEAFRAKLLVIDALPESRLAKDCVSDCGQGRGLICFYNDDAKKSSGTWTPDWWKQQVSVERTESMDDSHALLLRGTIKLPRDAKSVKDFYPQMTAPARVLREFKQKTGVVVQRYVWDEGDDADHYRHAFNYACLARSIATVTGGGIVVGDEPQKRTDLPKNNKGRRLSRLQMSAIQDD